MSCLPKQARQKVNSNEACNYRGITVTDFLQNYRIHFAEETVSICKSDSESTKGKRVHEGIIPSEFCIDN